MTTSPATDIAGYLATQNIGSLGGQAKWAIGIGTERKSPNDVITVYDTGGPEHDTDQLDIHYPTIQVRVRANDYNEGYAKSQEILILLHVPGERLIGTSRYKDIESVADILPIGKDDNDRMIFTTNYRAFVQPQE